MSTEDEVRKASEQFYAAVNRMVNGDAGPLADIWSHSAVVTTMHPIGGREVGWDKVRQSWEQVAQLASEGQVKLGCTAPGSLDTRERFAQGQFRGIPR